MLKKTWGELKELKETYDKTKKTLIKTKLRKAIRKTNEKLWTQEDLRTTKNR